MNWNANVDGDTATGTPTVGGDDPWNFGTNAQYPRLKFGHNADSLALQQSRLSLVNYDQDGNDLIEVRTLAQLNAIRYDLDGNGAVAASDRTNYTAAFPNPDDGMGCASGVGNCKGYELASDLDFAGSAYASNWTPIGNAANPYTGDFNGQGYLIRNLTIDVDDVTEVGLFGKLQDGAVQRVSLVDVDIDATYTTGTGNVGALAGILDQSATGTTALRYSYATGALDITASGPTALRAGGLVGTFTRGVIAASWSSADLTIASTVSNTNREVAGGLVGLLNPASTGAGSTVLTSYATGDVTATRNSASGGCTVGGLAGFAWRNVFIRASYATGTPDCTATGGAASTEGGLLGSALSPPGSVVTITASYWDSTRVTGTSRLRRRPGHYRLAAAHRLHRHLLRLGQLQCGRRCRQQRRRPLGLWHFHSVPHPQNGLRRRWHRPAARRQRQPGLR